MLIKVCGITDAANMREVARLGPDMMGFIFHPASPRDVSRKVDALPLDRLPEGLIRVAVLVNHPLEEVLNLLGRYPFDAVQLHGEEPPAYCRELRHRCPEARIIRAFGVEKGLPEALEAYEGLCDYYLFDTAGPLRGGSGQGFDHGLLKAYRGKTPFLLAGGLAPGDAAALKALDHPSLAGFDLNSRFEIRPGIKDPARIASFLREMGRTEAASERPDSNPMAHPGPGGCYGGFGGAFIPELLYRNVEELSEAYLEILGSGDFQREFHALLARYVGRPTPLYFAPRLSEYYRTRIYLKREDLCHTGAHKLNNVVGQALLARRMGKQHIVAETGAGQHGVATATVCALLKIPCTVFMGEKDMQRQALNVLRMRMLGAEVVPVRSGTRTLKDATSEAIRYWINHPDRTYYLIGSSIGPHPYPDLVTRLQSVISKEIREQLLVREGRSSPDAVIACVGGGSNAAGAFYHFIGNGHSRLIGAEASGEGTGSGLTAATLAVGKAGVLHGTYTLLMQDGHGQVAEAHSLSAGLDYPGIGPLHAHLHEKHLATYVPVSDQEALDAAMVLTRLEGIIPALESAHALAVPGKMAFGEAEVVVISLSGRGDKDMETYEKQWKQE
jgi:phosphoribosylanthranilate isomerase